MTCPLALRSSRCATLIEHQPVELRAGRTVEQDMRVNRIVVTLDSIRVLAQRSRYREFDENRKHRGIGKFFDEFADQLQRRREELRSSAKAA